MSSSIFAISKQTRVTDALTETTGQILPFKFKSRLLVQNIFNFDCPIARADFQNAVGYAGIDTIQKSAPADIFRGVRNGIFRFGMFGLDMLTETTGNADIQQIADQNDLVIYIKSYPNNCTFNLLFPKNDPRSSLNDLTANDTVVTAYPETLRSIFEQNARGNIPAIMEVESGVEGYVGMPSLDNPSRKVTVAFDLVETGNTARANGLKIGDKLMETGLIIIARKQDAVLMEQLGDAWGFVPYGEEQRPSSNLRLVAGNTQLPVPAYPMQMVAEISS